MLRDPTTISDESNKNPTVDTTSMKTEVSGLRRPFSNFTAAKKSAAFPLLAILLSHTSTVAFSNSNSNSRNQKRHTSNTNKHQYRRTMSLLMMDTDDLAIQANSYASANGIQVEKRRADDATAASYFEGAPMSLLPNAYPRETFAQAVEVAPAFNELVDRVSRDAEFLEETLGGGVSSMDPYTAKILELYQEVYVDEVTANAAAKSADRLGILRSDYMLHRDDDANNDNDNDDGGAAYQLKQVELNTIASSFAGLSCKISNLHRYLTARFEPETKEFLQSNVQKVSSSSEKSSGPVGVPANPALEELPLAMKVAYDRYVERFVENSNDSNSISNSNSNNNNNSKPAILFVVQEGETNTVDQRLLEFALWETHGIPVIRKSLTRLDEDLVLSDGDGVLRLKDSGLEIAVVYFRAGYAPTDYPGGEDGPEWRARKTLETSKATKCPCLGYHLAGTKKVQQELARPGVLERFFKGPDELSKVVAMRACFAGLYSMGDDATEDDLAATRDVLDGSHSRYVLKPQREGGGYNFYGEDLAKKLAANVVVVESGNGNETGDTIRLDKSLAEYILMQRLFPPQQTAILMRGGRVEGTGESISELGAFGTLLVDADGGVVHNKYAGFLLRTKFSNVDEGGVASGFATLSSPYLC